MPLIRPILDESFSDNNYIVANELKMSADNIKTISKYVVNELKCVYFNARSIVNKIDELQLLLEAEHPDVIGISETWLKETILDNELNVNDYNIYRHDRVNKIGGGVLLLVQKSIKTIIREDLTNKFNEIVWCDLITRNRKLVIGVCYRSPSITIEDDNSLYDLLNVVSKENIILMGDFNFGNSIDWKSNVSHGQGKIFL